MRRHAVSPPLASPAQGGHHSGRMRRYEVMADCSMPQVRQPWSYGAPLASGRWPQRRPHQRAARRLANKRLPLNLGLAVSSRLSRRSSPAPPAPHSVIDLPCALVALRPQAYCQSGTCVIASVLRRGDGRRSCSDCEPRPRHGESGADRRDPRDESCDGASVHAGEDGVVGLRNRGQADGEGRQGRSRAYDERHAGAGTPNDDREQAVAPAACATTWGPVRTIERSRLDHG